MCIPPRDTLGEEAGRGIRVLRRGFTGWDSSRYLDSRRAETLSCLIRVFLLCGKSSRSIIDLGNHCTEFRSRIHREFRRESSRFLWMIWPVMARFLSSMTGASIRLWSLLVEAYGTASTVHAFP